MGQVDFILDEEGEDKIINGDFAVGNADNDNAEMLMYMQKGHTRHFPNTGIGMQNNLNSTLSFVQQDEIREQFRQDGYTVSLLYKVPNSEEIVINFT